MYVYKRKVDYKYHTAHGAIAYFEGIPPSLHSLLLGRYQLTTFVSIIGVVFV